jgi:hypothetical protein
MHSKLTLSWFAEGDGTGELTVSFVGRGFSGSASAWFGVDDIIAKANAFAAYPLTCAPPALRGGLLTSDSIFLSIRPVGCRGNLILAVKLRDLRSVSNEIDVCLAAEVELLTAYQDVAEFSKNLIRLAQGDCESFEFHET